jgi:hypothetical protein
MESSSSYSSPKSASFNQISKTNKNASTASIVLGRFVTGIFVILCCTASGGILVAGVILYLFAHYRPSYFTLDSFGAALIANLQLAIVTASIGAVIGFLVGVVMALRGSDLGDIFG